MRIGGLNSSIFDSLYDGVLIINENSDVIYVNPSYTRITKVVKEDIVGKKLYEVRPGSRLQEVIKSKKKLLGIKRVVDNIEYFVNMVPIFENGQVVAAVSILNATNDIYKLMETLNTSKKIIKELKEKIRVSNKPRYTFDSITAQDTKTKNLKNFGKKISKKKINILITGESGTGKELLAQAIHNESDRRDEPFIAINCATFESNLLESELFGYEDGTFTGAKKGGKIGLFQKAQGGTVFLDEISEMDYNLQAKLLRVLQENVIRPIGAVNEIPIDVRILAATNRNLENMIVDKAFRADLYYRIAVFTIDTIPLRERLGDIKPLVSIFIEDSKKKFDRQVEISKEVFDIFYSYKWDGNVRELKNTIEFGVMMAEEGVIRVEHLPKKLQVEGSKKNMIPIKTLKDSVKEFERREINKVMDIYGNTLEGKKKAAKALGISLASLYNKTVDNQ